MGGGEQLQACSRVGSQCACQGALQCEPAVQNGQRVLICPLQKMNGAA